ncbi:MAG TPA: hypothetical protein VMM13_14845, partial [Euzebya sp.]|nr:hypothetical protein [Euzebya sp.]
MGFRFGLLAGLAAGYVLGTRDGRERYEQLVEATQALRESETARALEGSLKDAWLSAQQEWPALR